MKKFTPETNRRKLFVMALVSLLGWIALIGLLVFAVFASCKAHAETPTLTPSPTCTPFYVVGPQNLVEAFPQPGFDRTGIAAQYAHSLDGQTTWARILWASEEAKVTLAKQTTKTTEAKYNAAFLDWNGWHGTKDYLDTVEAWAIELKDGAAEKKAKKLKEKLLKEDK